MTQAVTTTREASERMFFVPEPSHRPLDEDPPEVHASVHRTARDWYAVKLINGDLPETVVGGPLDGLQYFLVDLGTPEDDREYWLTDVGLFDPPGFPR